MSENTTVITVAANVQAPIEKIWTAWNEPQHVTQWNSASPDWHTPVAENDLRVGGSFKYRMEAKDGSFGFDFEGVYDEVKPNELISYTMSDGRKVSTSFNTSGDATTVTTNFDAENENPVEMQQGGWQAILDNFKKYAETL